MNWSFTEHLAAPVKHRRHGPYGGLLTRYTLREIAVPALLAIVVIGFVGVAQELSECHREKNLPLEFISAWDVARLVFYFSPMLAAYIIPITYMMGILLAFGGLAQNNEITAMKAAGIPLKRAIAPVIVTGLLLSGLSFVLMERVQPWAAAKANHILFIELPQRITLEVLPTGSVQKIGDWRVYFAGRDAANKTLTGIVIRVPKQNGEWVFYAKEARFVDDPKGAVLVLKDGYIIVPQQDDTVTRAVFSDWSMPVPATMERTIPGLRRTMSLNELLAKEQQVAKLQTARPSRENTEDLRKIRTEIADRLTLPLACLAVSFIAAPLAVRSPRSGRSYSFALGFAIIFVFYMLRMLLDPSNLVTLNDAVLRGLVPSLVLCAAGAVAVWRVDRV
ncbi:MAG: LptF/LptG family permease [Candidatus Hydrogenedentes bacterium]|nr:LptF/LptG family permease [Candidatus Hydrogenedentota bacterium]